MYHLASLRRKPPEQQQQPLLPKRLEIAVTLPATGLPFLWQPWDKKLHRSWPKLSQVENTNCPTVVATSLDCPCGKLLFGFRSSCIDDVSYISVPDHTAAILAARGPIHCVCHRNPQHTVYAEATRSMPRVRLFYPCAKHAFRPRRGLTRKKMGLRE
jgi:hypothetical protein